MRHFTVYVSAIVSLLVSACSPTYVLQSAYQQGKILWAREPIEKLLQSERLDPDLKERLRLTLDAKSFAQHMGLNVGGAFSDYVDVQKDVLTWVVVGSRQDSFQLYSWWFPIVGSVPYKGFFEREQADIESVYLERRGYETFVRGAEAFSTLGWFDDPLFSTTARKGPVHLVSTVIHESVHTTVWIKDSVAFNESLANFVATEATIEFFESLSNSLSTTKIAEQLLTQARRSAGYQYEFSAMIVTLYDELASLYGRTDVSQEQKLIRRTEIFNSLVAPFRARYPSIEILSEINNAEIVQYALYLKDLELFKRLYDHNDRVWSQFFEDIESIALKKEQNREVDPFVALREMVEKLS